MINQTQATTILFENEACLVLNKRCGEVGQMSNGHLWPVHRLDTPASGCLLLAKTKMAAAFLSSAFAAERAVEKRYWAIVEKARRHEMPPTGEWQEAVHWIQFASRLNKSFAYIEKKANTKRALLRWRFVGSGDHYLFLELELITGRHHQIRAQLAAIGLHIKGDLKYGARRSEKDGGIRLHARSLSFPNPLYKQSTELNQPETILVEALPLFQDQLWEAFLNFS